MKNETKIILVLLFLSPALGELLSGSAPPVVFFNPVALFLLVLLYGCGTLLIREAKARWQLQWSVILLAVAYGIVEEGLMVKSFFNPGWQDMGTLSAYGMFLGVQWAWTIMLILYHATISTLIPITIVDQLWPDYRNIPLLKKRGLLLTFSGITVVTLLGMAFFGTMEDGKMVPYYPDPLLLGFSLITVILLIRKAYGYRNSRISKDSISLRPPFVFGAAGLMFQALNLILPNAMAENQFPAVRTILVQLMLALFAVLFVVYQVYHKDVTGQHIVSLVSGSVIFFILLTPVQEFGATGNPDPTRGMLLVGITAAVLLMLWRHRVLKNEINFEKPMI